MAELVSTTTRIFLAGHTGLVGGSIYRTLRQQGFENILVRDLDELDLTDPAATRRFFDEERPEAVIDAAAKVGGIMANWEQPWEFVEQNLLIELNLIGEAFRHEVQRLVFLGSSCIYPREAPQPLKEEYLLTGPLEETNRAYAIAKIARHRAVPQPQPRVRHRLPLADADQPVRPRRQLRPRVQPRAAGDDPQVPRGQGRRGGGRGGPEAGLALWGTGTPRREFLYVEDVGRAITFCLQNVHAADVPDGLLNVGCGEDLTIRDLAGIVQRVVGYEGPVLWDDSRPDGTPRKLMDVSRIRGARLGARGRPRGRHPPHLRLVPGEPGVGPATPAAAPCARGRCRSEARDRADASRLAALPQGSGDTAARHRTRQTRPAARPTPGVVRWRVARLPVCAWQVRVLSVRQNVLVARDYPATVAIVGRRPRSLRSRVHGVRRPREGRRGRWSLRAVRCAASRRSRASASAAATPPPAATASKRAAARSAASAGA